MALVDLLTDLSNFNWNYESAGVNNSQISDRHGQEPDLIHPEEHTLQDDGAGTNLSQISGRHGGVEPLGQPPHSEEHSLYDDGVGGIGNPQSFTVRGYTVSDIISGRHGGTVGPTPALPLHPDTHSDLDNGVGFGVSPSDNPQSFDVRGYTVTGTKTFDRPNEDAIIIMTNRVGFPYTPFGSGVKTGPVDFLSGVQSSWGPETLPLGFSFNMVDSLLSPGTPPVLSLDTLRHTIPEVGPSPTFTSDYSRYDEELGSQFNTVEGIISSQYTDTEKLHSSYGTQFHISGFNRSDMYITNIDELSTPIFKSFTRGSVGLGKIGLTSPNFNPFEFGTDLPYVIPQITATGPQTDSLEFSNIPKLADAHSIDSLSRLTGYPGIYIASQGEINQTVGAPIISSDGITFTGIDASFDHTTFRSRLYKVYQNHFLTSPFTPISLGTDLFDETGTTQPWKGGSIHIGAQDPAPTIGGGVIKYGNLTRISSFSGLHSTINNLYSSPKGKPSDFSGTQITFNPDGESSLNLTPFAEGAHGSRVVPFEPDTTQIEGSLITINRGEVSVIPPSWLNDLEDQFDFATPSDLELLLFGSPDAPTISQPVYTSGTVDISSDNITFGSFTPSDIPLLPLNELSPHWDPDGNNFFTFPKDRAPYNISHRNVTGTWNAWGFIEKHFGLDSGQPGASTTQPYIIRKIGQRWGTDGESHNFVEHIVSNLVNSVTTIAARTLADEIRITAWEASPRGIQWAATQAALQLFNPRKETRVWNPLSIQGSLPPMFHVQRHLGDTYSEVTKIDLTEGGDESSILTDYSYNLDINNGLQDVNKRRRGIEAIDNQMEYPTPIPNPTTWPTDLGVSGPVDPRRKEFVKVKDVGPNLGTTYDTAKVFLDGQNLYFRKRGTEEDSQYLKSHGAGSMSPMALGQRGSTTPFGLLYYLDYGYSRSMGRQSISNVYQGDLYSNEQSYPTWLKDIYSTTDIPNGSIYSGFSSYDGIRLNTNIQSPSYSHEIFKEPQVSFKKHTGLGPPEGFGSYFDTHSSFVDSLIIDSLYSYSTDFANPGPYFSSDKRDGSISIISKDKPITLGHVGSVIAKSRRIHINKKDVVTAGTSQGSLHTHTTKLDHESDGKKSTVFQVDTKHSGKNIYKKGTTLYLSDHIGGGVTGRPPGKLASGQAGFSIAQRIGDPALIHKVTRWETGDEFINIEPISITEGTFKSPGIPDHDGTNIYKKGTLYLTGIKTETDGKLKHDKRYPEKSVSKPDFSYSVEGLSGKPFEWQSDKWNIGTPYGKNLTTIQTVAGNQIQLGYIGSVIGKKNIVHKGGLTPVDSFLGFPFPVTTKLDHESDGKESKLFGQNPTMTLASQTHWHDGKNIYNKNDQYILVEATSGRKDGRLPPSDEKRKQLFIGETPWQTNIFGASDKPFSWKADPYDKEKLYTKSGENTGNDKWIIQLGKIGTYSAANKGVVHISDKFSFGDNKPYVVEYDPLGKSKTKKASFFTAPMGAGKITAGGFEGDLYGDGSGKGENLWPWAKGINKYSIAIASSKEQPQGSLLKLTRLQIDDTTGDPTVVIKTSHPQSSARFQTAGADTLKKPIKLQDFPLLNNQSNDKNFGKEGQALGFVQGTYGLFGNLFGKKQRYGHGQQAENYKEKVDKDDPNKNKGQLLKSPSELTQNVKDDNITIDKIIAYNHQPERSLDQVVPIQSDLKTKGTEGFETKKVTKNLGEKFDNLPGAIKTTPVATGTGNLLDRYSTLAYGKLNVEKTKEAGGDDDQTQHVQLNYEKTLRSASEINKSFGPGGRGPIIASESHPEGVGAPDNQGRRDKSKQYKADAQGHPGKSDVTGVVQTVNDEGLRGLVKKSGDKYITALTDKINMLRYGEDYKTGEEDFIKFKFRDLINEKFIIFRAALSSINENFSPEWSSEKYIGRPDQVHVYQGVNRSLSFDFMIVPHTRQELPIVWEKLNYLVGLTYPTWKNIGEHGKRMESPFMNLTIGDMYDKVPGFLSGLSITVEDDATWEIEEGFQLPKAISVSCEFTHIGQHVLATQGKHYDLGWLKEYDNTNEWITGDSHLHERKNTSLNTLLNLPHMGGG